MPFFLDQVQVVFFSSTIKATKAIVGTFFFFRFSMFQCETNMNQHILRNLFFCREGKLTIQRQRSQRYIFFTNLLFKYDKKSFGKVYSVKGLIFDDR